MQSRRSVNSKKVVGTNNHLKLPYHTNASQTGGPLSPTRASGNSSPNRYSSNKASTAHKRGNGSVGARMITTKKTSKVVQASTKQNVAEAFGDNQA